jgi:hypothetical protein
MTEKNHDIPAASQPQKRRRLRFRATLFAGFGALLVLMGTIFIDSLHTLGVFETNNAQIRRDFLYREQVLEQVQVGLYESGNIVSDYVLIESDPHAQEILRTELQSIEDKTTAELKACIQSLPAGKKAPFQHLSTALETYWSTIGPIFASALK